MRNLRLLREEKGISQQKLAEAIGSTQQAIHRYENGDYEPDIQTISSLADFFDTSIDYLVGRTDIRKKIEPVEKYALNHEETKLVDEVRSLAPEYRKYISKVLDALLEIVDK